ncbi:hypothetical protein COL24_05350 [Bacillus toyonensis]|uniref:hypothetical protein n=1 Tax=Bacillus toyonensis TaxID=155322 RepID=UPI000BF3BF36|nr:hypothetical protein [Bacillus toyonensis]PFX43688.1 hypothetical protein COL24_05350 [Bacillus toyonensis]
MITLKYSEPVKGIYENKEYDFDRYDFIKKRPISTHETSVIVDFIGNKITGDTIAYGSWYDIELQECIEYLKTLQPSEILRDFSHLIVPETKSTLNTIEKSFVWQLSNEEEGKDLVECIIHSFEMYEEIEDDDDHVGNILITIGHRERMELTIWNSGCSDPTNPNYEDHYVCLPTMLEESEEDPFENVQISDLLARVGA